MNGARYPKLAAVAKRYLCIPATSMPGERVFSHCGSTLTKIRVRLGVELRASNVFEIQHDYIML